MVVAAVKAMLLLEVRRVAAEVGKTLESMMKRTMDMLAGIYGVGMDCIKGITNTLQVVRDAVIAVVLAVTQIVTDEVAQSFEGGKVLTI